jgi:hypothetical protein
MQRQSSRALLGTPCSRISLAPVQVGGLQGGEGWPTDTSRPLLVESWAASSRKGGCSQQPHGTKLKHWWPVQDLSLAQRDKGSSISQHAQGTRKDERTRSGTWIPRAGRGNWQGTCLSKGTILSRAPWLTPIILATQEAEIRRIIVWSQPEQTVGVTPSPK